MFATEKIAVFSVAQYKFSAAPGTNAAVEIILHFYDVLDYLKPGDCLILNDSRVLPARIFGTKKDTGAHVEFLLLKCVGNNRWETLVKPGRKAKVGAEFVFSPGVLECKITDVLEDGNRIIDFSCEGNFYTILEELGKMPLPPYITE